MKRGLCRGARRAAGIAALALALALALCLGAAPGLAGDAEAPPVAYVHNPIHGDLLNLRARPDKRAESLGRYDTGAPVQVLAREGDWCRVRVGDERAGRIGYMRAEFLAFDWDQETAEINARLGWVCTQPGDLNPVARAEPEADAPEIARLQDGASIQILGEIGGQWLHVRFPGGDGPLAGFVPAELVIQRAPNQLEYAVSTVVINRAAKDRAGLRAAPRNDARLLGEYDSGTQILILGHAGKWAQVALEGGADDRATARGYMRLDALDDGSGLLPMSLVTDHYAQADPPEGSGFVTVRAQPDESGAALGKLPRGALFSVLGEAGAWLRIRLDATQGYLPADQVRMLARQNSLGDGPYPWVRQAEGYAVISAPQGAPGVWTYPFCDERAPEGMIGRRVHDTVLLIRDLGDWSQIQDGYTPACFIRSDRLRVLPIPALAAGKTDAGARFALRAGEYTVGRDLPADLYCFRAPQGKAGRIEILGQGGAFIRRYAAENGDFYNLYLPEGARLTLLGDGLLTGLDKTFLWMLGDQSTSYTGSGRFLMRVNVDGTLRVEPASADADAYYIVSAFSQEEGPAPVPVRIHPGQEASIELDDGGFIEIHNCRISTNG